MHMLPGQHVGVDATISMQPSDGWVCKEVDQL